MRRMEDIVTGLDHNEMEHVLLVLNRDRSLQQSEEVRVAKLRIDLVREKRQGALVAGRQYARRQDSRCARCLDGLDWSDWWDHSKARCVICKHLICKKCRVHNWRNDQQPVESDTSNEEIATASRLRTSSAPVLPSQAISTVSAVSYHSNAHPAVAERRKVTQCDATTQTDLSIRPNLSVDPNAAECPLCSSSSSRSESRCSTDAIDESRLVERISASAPDLKSISGSSPLSRSVRRASNEQVSSSARPQGGSTLRSSSLRRPDQVGELRNAHQPVVRSQSSRQPRPHSIASPMQSSVAILARSIADQALAVRETRATSQPDLRSSMNFELVENVSATAGEETVQRPRKESKGSASQDTLAKVSPRQEPKGKSVSRKSSKSSGDQSAKRSDLGGARHQLDTDPDYDRRLNPFLDDTPDYDPHLNPFLASSDETEENAKAEKIPPAKKEPRNPFVDSTSSSEKEESTPASGTATPLKTKPALASGNVTPSQNTAALRFLAMAGVTPPKRQVLVSNSAPHVENSPRRTSLLNIADVRRKIDFTSSLSQLFDGGFSRTSTPAAKPSSELKLSASFSGIAASLAKPFGFLTPKSEQVGSADDKVGGAGSTPGPSSSVTSTKGTEDKPVASAEVTSFVEVEPVRTKPENVDNTVERSEISDLTLQNRSAETSSPSKDRRQSDERPDTVEVALNVIPPTPKPSSLETEFPIFARLDKLVRERRRLSEQSDASSVSGAIASSMILAASPLSVDNSSAESDGSSTETEDENADNMQSDYSSEASFNAHSDAADGDVDDSDVPSPTYMPRKPECRAFGSSAESVEDTQLPTRRKGTRDSGYMTTDDGLKLLQLSDAENRYARAHGAVQRRSLQARARSKPDLGIDPSNKQTPPAMTSRGVTTAGKGTHANQGGSAWICKVCHKTIEVQRQTGDWFAKASAAEGRKYQHKFQSAVGSQKGGARIQAPCAARASRARGKRTLSHPEILLRSKMAANINSNSTNVTQVPPTARAMRRSTADSIAPIARQPDQTGKNLSGYALYQAMRKEAAKKQWAPRTERKTISDQLRAELQKHFPGAGRFT